MKKKTTTPTKSGKLFSTKEIKKINEVTKGIEAAVLEECRTSKDLKLLKAVRKTSTLIQKKQIKILKLVGKRIDELSQGLH